MENHILENEIDLELSQHYETASTGQRFANHIIDMILYYLIFFLIFLFIGALAPDSFIVNEDNLNTKILTYGIMYLVILTYFTSMELYTGKTVGKMVTGTKVIRQDGMKLTFRDCIVRSLCRLIPFEGFSAFSSSGIMWHDSIADTYVVKDTKLNRI